MRLFCCRTTALTLVVLLVACTTVSPDQCWPNTSGGFGGSGALPIGAGVGVGSGDFRSPPRGPLDYTDPPNPCIEPETPCRGKCLTSYEDTAAECGRIANEAQRRTCQDGAYATYRSCTLACEQSDATSKKCTDKFVNCQNSGPTFCMKVSGGQSICRQCRDRCNAGDSPSPTCKKCLF
jgi:hypothetical protein